MTAANETARIEAFSDGVFAIFDAYRYGPFWSVAAFALSFESVTASLLVSLGLAVFFALPRENEGDGGNGIKRRNGVNEDETEREQASGRDHASPFCLRFFVSPC